MARVSTALTNFTGGQLSDRMEGRTDFQKYFSGCKTLENFIVQPHGSVTRRPGTTFVAEVKTSSAFTRLIPFEFSTEQSYALEFGKEYIRFYKDNGAVLESNLSITGITKANPGVVTGSFSTSSYPVVESTAVYTSAGTAVTTAPVTMPSNIITNDLLIMIVKVGSTNTATTPTGWTLLSSRSSTGSSYIYYKISDGSEGSVVNLTPSSSSHVSAITYRISNYEGTPEASFAATNVNDPPSLTTSWSSTKNLFIATCTTRQSNNAFTAAPTGYSDLLTIGDPSSGTTTHVRLAAAAKEANAQTDDPAAFTTTGTLDNPQSATIAVKGSTTSVNNGDTIVISGVGGMTQVNGKRFIVANKTTTTFELKDIDGNNVNTTNYTTYTSGGVFNRVYTLATPYETADLADLKFAQSADVMYICHPDYAIHKLSRTGHTSWTIEEVLFTNGPFLDHNITATTLTASATTGDGITITASDVVGINGGSGFQSTDVGRLIHLGTNKGHVEIISVSSTLIVVADVIETLSTTSATTDWALGAWSTTTGYPSCVSFFEQRLVFAGTNDQPQTIFFSRSGDYENFDENYHGTIAADDAITYTIASNQVNVIQSLKATRTLIILTSGGEFTLNSDSTGTAVSPTNINIKKQSNYGAANLDALSVGNATLFIQRAKRKLRELAYNFDTDGYVAPDMTILAEDITLNGINETTYQQEPHSIVWGVRGDGILVGLTYQRSEQVVAWHQHKLGGSFGATAYGIVESVISISGNSYNRTDEDQVWVIVKRTINGVTRRYVEYFTPFQFDSSLTQFQFVDSALSYSGSATSTLTGLDHLNASTVRIIANGATHPDKTVSSGSITLDRTTTAAKVGLAYTSTLQTMRLDVGSQDGTSQGKTKRIFDVTLRFYETVGAKVGPDLNNLEEIPFRSSAASMDAAVPLFTGDKKIEFRGNFETDGYLFVVQDQALPMTLLSLYPRLITNDG